VTDGQGSPLARSGTTRSELGSGPARGGTRGYLWWALLVIPLWAVLVLCTHWEPVMRDGWGHIGWYRDHPAGLRTFYEFCKEIYLHENPRLGQFLTLLVYARGPYHAIVTPVVELGVFTMLTVLALGRWPSVRRSDDALVAALVTAIIAVCVPQVGAMLFYRPFTGNYTFGLALNLLWLVPYRLEIEAARPARIWLAPVMLVLGIVAGLCNEHTGLGFLAMGLVATVAGLRRGGLRIWMIAGLCGLAAGYVVLLTAPGQHVRYAGLAGQAGILGRIADRGLLGNLVVLGVLALAVLPMLPLAVIARTERRAPGAAARSATSRWSCVVLALGGIACTVTLFASPKIGPRLYFASVALIGAGLAGWLAAVLRRTWTRRGCAILAIGVLAVSEVWLVWIHAAVGPRGAIRRDRIEHAARGAVVTVPRYPFRGSHFFLGDDFRVATLRQAIAVGYGLQAVELEAPDDRPDDR